MKVPPGARLILIDAQDRVLFLQAREPLTGAAFWVMPGGGLDPGETFEEAARWELHEETGISAEIGPCVWHRRRHIHVWDGRDADQFERFFVVRLEGEVEISGAQPDSYISGHRWWSVEEIMRSSDDFAPRRVAELLPAVMEGCHVGEPMDCGV